MTDSNNDTPLVLYVGTAIMQRPMAVGGHHLTKVFNALITTDEGQQSAESQYVEHVKGLLAREGLRFEDFELYYLAVTPPSSDDLIISYCEQRYGMVKP